MAASHMLRPIAIQRYLDTLTHTHGIEPGRLLLGTALTPEGLARPATLVEPGQSRAVVENLLKLSGNRGIGFDIWSRPSLLEVGVVGYATLTSRTVRDAYPLWRRYARALVGLTGSFRIVDENADGVTFVFDGLDPLDPLVGFYTEELIGIFAMMGTRLLSESPTMVRATFAYRPPGHAERYEQLLGCPVEFGAPRTSITLARHW
ncbi:MAG TPA: AraC family transcriptional regulator, partial [Burkholderiaceae bacterium]|nr:AraC family transcriptional regulator [Burkholderiaceae bacterium]